jgi:hypothetical protein
MFDYRLKLPFTIRTGIDFAPGASLSFAQCRSGSSGLHSG